MSRAKRERRVIAASATHVILYRAETDGTLRPIPEMRERAVRSESGMISASFVPVGQRFEVTHAALVDKDNKILIVYGLASRRTISDFRGLSFVVHETGLPRLASLGPQRPVGPERFISARELPE